MKDRKELDALLAEQKKASRSIFEGKVLHLFLDEIETKNGVRSFREYARHRGAVAVVALDGEENVYLVYQYRYAIGRTTLEIPAGKLESGETDLVAAAARELSEEVGITAGKMTPLGTYLPSPAILTEEVHCFLAEDLSFGETHPDEDENLLTVKMPLEEAVSHVLAGDLQDGKTLFALQKVFLLKAREKGLL